MKGKLTEGEQANRTKDERQKKRESLTIVLLCGRLDLAHFSLRSHPHDCIPGKIERMHNG